MINDTGIYLTDKQQEAKEKLEDGLQRTHRGGFSSYAEFNEYMESLIKQIKKRINLSNAVKNGKTSYAEINAKKRANILKYYNNENNLKKYAIKYIQKYYPSYKKLLSKLTEKSKNEELSLIVIDYLLENGLQPNDTILINQYVNQYIAIGKNFNKIKNLLLKKMFPSDLISETLDKRKEILNGSLLDPFSLTKKIERLLKQGKSEYYIKQKYGDTQFDRDLIDEILTELNFDNSEIIQRELQKLKDKGLEKQKIIAKMSYKGYKYSDYQMFLDDY